MEGDIRCILNASPGWGEKMKKTIKSLIQISISVQTPENSLIQAKSFQILKDFVKLSLLNR